MPIPSKKEILAKKNPAPTRPWAPCNTMHIPHHMKDPGYDYRWCENIAKNIRAKLVEGWQIDDKLSKMFTPDVPTDYAKSLTSAIEVAGMIVMKLPKSLAKQRKEFYASKTEDNASQINRSFKESSKRDAPSGVVFGQGATIGR